MTQKGDMAWVPHTTRLGDRICFLTRCAVPFVIRPVEDEDNGKRVWELLGDCYLHNRMEYGDILLHEEPELFEFR